MTELEEYPACSTEHDSSTADGEICEFQFFNTFVLHEQIQKS
jgi:hypothetical protein